MKKQSLLSEKPVSDILKQYSLKSSVYTEKSIINSLKNLRNYTPLPYEKNDKNKCMETLVEEWFSQKMRQKYDELSTEIFKTEREIKAGPKKVKIKIPLLVSAELDKDEGWYKEHKYGGSYNDNYKLELFSKIPSIPLEVRKAGREAIGFTYKIYGEALCDETLSTVMKENPKYAPHPSISKLFVLWKPKPQEIQTKVERIEKDPVLVLKYYKPYLVSTWTEPEEEPFMHLVSACTIRNLDSFMIKENVVEHTNEVEEDEGDESYEDRRDIFG